MSTTTGWPVTGMPLIPAIKCLYLTQADANSARIRPAHLGRRYQILSLPMLYLTPAPAPNAMLSLPAVLLTKAQRYQRPRCRRQSILANKRIETDGCVRVTDGVVKRPRRQWPCCHCLVMLVKSAFDAPMCCIAGAVAVVKKCTCHHRPCSQWPVVLFKRAKASARCVVMAGGVA